jgi:hypothetical protein
MVFQEKCTIVAFLGKLAWDVYGTGFAVIGWLKLVHNKS